MMNRRDFLKASAIATLSLPELAASAAAAQNGDAATRVQPPVPVPESYLDLTAAAIVYPENFSGPELKAIAMLIDEVEKRTQVRWRTTHHAANALAIEIDRASGPPEGYRIKVESGRVSVTGNDARGVLFGIGRMLRALRMSKGAVRIPESFAVSTAPKYPLRGHQLSYRSGTNSGDAWSLRVWEQYIRDLAVFGANAVELLPPRTSRQLDASPHHTVPPMQMMIGMAKLLVEYGLDVWVWYPAVDRDYSDPQILASSLQEWGEVFRQLPRLDALFIPGGDPGHTPLKSLMMLAEKQAANLRHYHPQAQLWLSPQGFDQKSLDEFYAMLRAEPKWLTGIAWGQQVRVPLARLREAVPRRYPIRHYVDLTHSRGCHMPVPDWDVAYAATEGRTPINPRPTDEFTVFRALQPYTIGFLSYSEGCHDDVNKFVWNALGWNPESDLKDILREFSRYFIGESYTESFAQGLLALERNWRSGPLLTNEGVYGTLQQFQAMERGASPQDLLNWRFQQALYRAYYDAYTRSRLLYETALEDRAIEELRHAPRTGSLEAMVRAEAILSQVITQPVSQDWRARVFELAEALFQSIGMQLSVTRYQAYNVASGANLDTIDVPLNNRVWLQQRFAELRAKSDEAERQRGLEAIVEWTNPGPGGFYDELGNLTRRPHLIRGVGYEKDPALMKTANIGFHFDTDRLTGVSTVLSTAGRMSWWRYGLALFDAPLRLHYTGLDPSGQYRVRVIYPAGAGKMRMLAGDIEVHPLMSRPNPPRPLEWDVPTEATKRGELTLTWYAEQGLGGNGRSCQVAEVWLILKSPSEPDRRRLPM